MPAPHSTLPWWRRATGWALPALAQSLQGLPWGRGALWLGVGLLLALFGFFTTLFGQVAWLFTLAPALLFTSVVLAVALKLPMRQLAFGAALVLFLLLPLAYRFTGLNVVNQWQFLALGLALLGVPALLREARHDALLRAALLCFGLVLGLLVLSTLRGNTRPNAALYQFASDFKPWVLLALGFALMGLQDPGRWLWRLVDWAWLPLLVLVLAQWAAPGLYGRVMPFPGAPVAEASGWVPSRGMGVFEHPGMLAGMALALTVLGSARALLQPAPGRWLAPLGYGALLLASGGRGELAAALVALLGLLLWKEPTRLFGRLLWMLPVAALAGATFWFFAGDSLTDEAQAWGASQTQAVEQPRAQLYEGAITLANRHLPLGNGLGTYGGPGASKFDQRTYERLGFTRYWWFRSENYLLDLYWHNVLGEGGWIAAALQLASYLLLVGYALRSQARSAAGSWARVYWAGAGFGTVAVLVNSLASPAFQDPRLFIWAAVCFGLAVRERSRV